MKTTEKTANQITINVFLAMIMLFGSASINAQSVSPQTLSIHDSQEVLLYASYEQKSETSAPAYFNSAMKSKKSDKVLVQTVKSNVEITNYKLMEALEVSFEEDMYVEEWMITNFSYNAQAIQCQPLSDEPALEVEEWMVSGLAWSLGE